MQDSLGFYRVSGDHENGADGVGDSEHVAGFHNFFFDNGPSTLDPSPQPTLTPPMYYPSLSAPGGPRLPPIRGRKETFSQHFDLDVPWGLLQADSPTDALGGIPPLARPSRMDPTPPPSRMTYRKSHYDTPLDALSVAAEQAERPLYPLRQKRDFQQASHHRRRDDTDNLVDGHHESTHHPQGYGHSVHDNNQGDGSEKRVQQGHNLPDNDNMGHGRHSHAHDHGLGQSHDSLHDHHTSYDQSHYGTTGLYEPHNHYETAHGTKAEAEKAREAARKAAQMPLGPQLPPLHQIAQPMGSSGNTAQQMSIVNLTSLPPNGPPALGPTSGPSQRAPSKPASTSTSKGARPKSYCEECGRWFADLMSHKQTHIAAESRPNTCGICGRGFARPNDLHRHQRSHVRGSQFRCPLFIKSPDTPSEAGYEYLVPSCHQTGEFSRGDTYKSHLKSLHFEYPPGTRKRARAGVGGHCRACGMHFDRAEIWISDHIETHACEGVRKVDEFKAQTDIQ